MPISNLGKTLQHTAALVVAELESPSPDPKCSLATARALAALADVAMRQLVANGRERGLTWQSIGDALGTSRQAAFQRFGGQAPPDPATGLPAAPETVARAMAVLADITGGRWGDVVATFGPGLASELSATSLADGYRAVIAMAGPLVAVGEPAATRICDRTVVDAPLRHEQADVTARVTLDDNDRVAGLWFLPEKD